MPEVKNFHKLPFFKDPVVDENWGVHQLPNAGPSGNGAADVGEALQEPDYADFADTGVHK